VLYDDGCDAVGGGSSFFEGEIDVAQSTIRLDSDAFDACVGLYDADCNQFGFD
jgi:hypothetical protein